MAKRKITNGIDCDIYSIPAFLKPEEGTDVVVAINWSSVGPRAGRKNIKNNSEMIDLPCADIGAGTVSNSSGAVVDIQRAGPTSDCL